MNQLPTKREKISPVSGDVLQEQIAKLRKLFPEVVAESKIDFDKLRATLGAAVETGPDRFSFTWAGKNDALALLQTPSRSTLVPCPQESVHFDRSGNVFIEGDNLEVLKLLFKPYFGRIKLIYIDPPYNTGHDFVYPDNYADPLHTYLQLTGQVDAEGNLLTSNPETSGRYHSAWLSMMYPRLFLARQLLREDGVIFVSIDDHEVHHLRMLMNEVFGEENFVGQLVWKARRSEDTRAKTGLSTDHEYLVCYRCAEEGALRGVEKDLSKFDNPDNDSRGPWRSADLTGLADKRARPNLHYDLCDPRTGINYGCPPKGWRFEPNTMRKKIEEWRILFPDDSAKRPRHKLFQNDMRSDYKTLSSIITDMSTADGTKEITTLLGNNVFPFPKPSSLVRLLVEQVAEGDDLVLDFFAGSCTTAQAVLELNREDGGNRKFIVVQLPEPTQNKDYSTIADIGKERIRRVLAKLQKEDDSKLDFADGKTPEDLGFKVFELAKPNIQQWIADANRDPEDYAAKLALFDDPLVSGWTAEQVLWEIALREGYSLNTRFEKKTLGNGNTVYEVSDPDTGQHFLVCLDDEVHVDVSKHCELTPDRLLVCRDRALDDTAAANLALQCRLKTI